MDNSQKPLNSYIPQSPNSSAQSMETVQPGVANQSFPVSPRIRPLSANPQLNTSPYAQRPVVSVGQPVQPVPTQAAPVPPSAESSPQDVERPELPFAHVPVPGVAVPPISETTVQPPITQASSGSTQTTMSQAEQPKPATPVTPKKSNRKRQVLGAVIVVILLALVGVSSLAYQNFTLQSKVSEAKQELSDTRQAAAAKIAATEQEIPVVQPVTEMPATPGKYQNEELGISFTYPEDWRQTENCLDSQVSGSAYPCFVSPDLELSDVADKTVDGQLVAILTDDTETVNDMLAQCSSSVICQNETLGNRAVLSITPAGQAKTYKKMYFDQFGKLVSVQFIHNGKNTTGTQKILDEIMKSFEITNSNVIPAAE